MGNPISKNAKRQEKKKSALKQSSEKLWMSGKKAKCVMKEKTDIWRLKRRYIGKRKMKEEVKINENKIYIKWVITGCLYFVRWIHQSVKRNQNVKQWNEEPAKLGWKYTGASLGQHNAWGFP